jgi:hypothetical protein
MAARRVKRVKPPPDHKKVLPRVLPPIDRPETPRDSRSVLSAHADRVNNLSLSGFVDFRDPTAPPSPLQPVLDLLSAARAPADFAAAIRQFSDATGALAQSGLITSADLGVYHDIYPLLSPVLATLPGCVLAMVVASLRNLLAAISSSQHLQPRPPRDLPTRNARANRLLPLGPIDRDSPTEHFHHFMAMILYKMSGATENDEYLAGFVPELVALTGDSHTVATRTFAVAALKNAAHSPVFRAHIVAQLAFSKIVSSLSTPVRKDQLFVQTTGLIRNLIVEASILDELIRQGLHLQLLSAMDTFPESAELVLNCFRILTKISERPAIRSELIERYKADGLLAKFLLLMSTHRTHAQILSRLCYVFADFVAYEAAVLSAASKVTRPLDIKLISELLGVQTDKSVSVMLVQVIANLSVDPDCASLLSVSSAIPRAMCGCTFDANDRLGFNLLCTASNFTFHDKSWAPAELLAAIPIAIVSKHIPSIIESLRTLCNVALSPTPVLIDTKIPEMLGILLRHSNSDVVLYSLQALANLVPYHKIKTRFRAAGTMDAVFELLDGGEIDEMELEAIAALLINFRTITADEADRFAAALDEYEVDRNGEVLGMFLDFLEERAGATA